MDEILSRGAPGALPQAPYGTQQFENWAVQLRMDAEKEGNIERVTGAEAMIRVNTALMIHEELQAKVGTGQWWENFRYPHYLAVKSTKLLLSEALQNEPNYWYLAV